MWWCNSGKLHLQTQLCNDMNEGPGKWISSFFPLSYCTRGSKTAGCLARTPTRGLRLRVLAGSGWGPEEAGDKNGTACLSALRWHNADRTLCASLCCWSLHETTDQPHSAVTTQSITVCFTDASHGKPHKLITFKPVSIKTPARDAMKLKMTLKRSNFWNIFMQFKKIHCFAFFFFEWQSCKEKTIV